MSEPLLCLEHSVLEGSQPTWHNWNSCRQKKSKFYFTIIPHPKLFASFRETLGTSMPIFKWWGVTKVRKNNNNKALMTNR